MEPEKQPARLHALDGLRGVAILFVFLNHVDKSLILNSTPGWLTPIVQTFFSSGVVAVSILFVLCGFLMAFLYENPTGSFLQKRYTRIFPLFLAMSTAMALIRFNSSWNWMGKLGVVILVAATFHVIWVYGVKKLRKPLLSKSLFIGFIALQLIVAAFYVLYIMRQPAAVFYNITPEPIRNGSIWLINSTLTLPFGTYIPMLDGVYWTLATELLFYILYPMLFVPIIGAVKQKPLRFKIFLLFSAALLLVGLHIIFKQILGFEMLQITLFYYFITGITLAKMFTSKNSVIKKIESLWRQSIIQKTSLLSIPFFFLGWFITVEQSHTLLRPWLVMLWAFPITLLVGMALDSSRNYAKFLENKALIFLGRISYSLYLCHTIIITISREMYQPKSSFEEIISIAVTFAAALCLSYILNYLLEKPYFDKSNATREKTKPIAVRIKKVVLTFAAAYVLFIIFAYQSQFNFFSIEKQHSNKHISLNTTPIAVIDIKASENNLGIIAMDILYTEEKSITAPQKQILTFKLREKGTTNYYAINTYNPRELNGQSSYPFGFPVIVDSKGKVYEAELSLTKPYLSQYVTVEQGSVKTIYSADKKYILTHPGALINHIWGKVETIVTNREAQISLMLGVPALALLISLI